MTNSGDGNQQNHGTAGILGPTQLMVGDDQVSLRPRESDVVAALVMRSPQTADELARHLWAERPATARKTIQNHVARIRRANPGLVETTEQGYRIVLEAGATDAARFEEMRNEARSLEADADHAAALATATAAQELWRGVPLPDLVSDEAGHRRHELTEYLHDLEDIAAGASLALGHADPSGLERLVDAAPEREGRWLVWIRALAARGERAQGLNAVARFRRHLRDTAGSGLGPEAQVLEEELLGQGDEPDRPARPGTGARRTERAARLEGAEAAQEQLRRFLKGGAPTRGRRWMHVNGPPGVGKTALLRWAKQEAQILGFVTSELDLAEQAMSPDGVSAPAQRPDSTSEHRATTLYVLDNADSAIIDPVPLPEPSLIISAGVAPLSPAAAPGTEWSTLQLRPWGADTLASYLTTELGPGVEPLVDPLLRWTGGIPLYIRDLLPHGVAEGFIVHRDSRWHMLETEATPPSGLATLLRRPLEGLSGPARQVLGAVCVAKYAVPRAELADIVELDPSTVTTACKTLATKGLCYEADAQLIPASVLVQHTVAHALGAIENANLHLRLATALRSHDLTDQDLIILGRQHLGAALVDTPGAARSAFAGSRAADRLAQPHTSAELRLAGRRILTAAAVPRGSSTVEMRQDLQTIETQLVDGTTPAFPELSDATAIISVLGPTEVRSASGVVSLRPRESTVVAGLVVAAQHPTTDLADQLWEDPPSSARKSIQNHVARIRRQLPEVIVTTDTGYALGADTIVDVHLFREQAIVARNAMASGKHEAAETAARRALQLWRGSPYEQLVGEFVETERALLLEWRSEVEDIEADAQRARGSVSLDDLERLAREAPDRPGRWLRWAKQLHAVGRRIDALEVLADRRRYLRSTSGLDLGTEASAFEQMLLRNTGESHDSRQRTAQATRGTTQAGTTSGTAEPRRAIAAALLEADGWWIDLAGAAGAGKTTMVQRAEALASEQRWSTLHVSLVHDRLMVQTSNGLRPAQDLGKILSDAGPRSLVVVDDYNTLPEGAAPAIRQALTSAGGLLTTQDPNAPAAAPLRHALVQALNDGVARQIALAPWSTDDVAEVLEGLLGESARPLAPDVLSWTDGSAEDVRAFIHNALDTGAIERSETGWFLAAERVSPSQQDEVSVRRRLSSVDPQALGLVEVLALAGPRVDPLYIAEAADCSPQLFDNLEAAGLVRREGLRYSLISPIAEMVISEGIDPQRRAQLNMNLAHMYEGRRDSLDAVVRAARCRLAAAEVDPNQALRSANGAAERAWQSGHRRMAADLWALARFVALRFSSDRMLLLDTTLRSGQALSAVGDPLGADHLFDAAERARELGASEHLGAVALALLHLGMFSAAGIGNDDVTRVAEDALKLGQDPVVKAEITSAMTVHLSMTDDPERCRGYFWEAYRLAQDIDDDELTSRVLPGAFMSLGGPNDLDARVQVADELRVLAERLGDPSVSFEAHQMDFSNALLRGDRSELDRSLRDALRAADELNIAAKTWSAGWLETMQAHVDGRLQQAMGANEETLALGLTSVTESLAVATYGAQLLGLHMDLGRLVELRPMIEQLIDDQPLVRGWQAAGAIVAAEDGDGPRALQLAERFAANDFSAGNEDFIWTASMFAIGRAVAMLGDQPLGQRVYQRLLPYAGRLCWTGNSTFGPLDEPLGLLTLQTDPQTAEDHFRAALDISERLVAPVFEARARLCLSYALAHQSRDADGDVERSAALDTADQFGAAGVFVLDRQLRGLGAAR